MVRRIEKLLFDISEIYNYWHRISSREMARYGLKGPYAIYIPALCHFPEGVTASRLGELCNRNKADVSRAMAAFEKVGFISRDTSSGNYRVLIRLTEQGQKVADEISLEVMKTVEMAGQGLTDSDRETFYQVLDLITRNLKNMGDMTPSSI